MIAIDTNVLLRVILKDDEVQANKARRLIKKQGEVFISNIVLSETIWVLESVYSFNKNNLITTLENLMRVSQFNHESPEAIWFALGEYHQSSCELTDCIIAAIARHHDCSIVMTFDKQAAKSEGFELIK